MSVPRQASSENIGRGTGLALLAIPVGIVVLVLLSSIGFVSAIVGFLVAFLAVFLYRRGSGGIISRTGAWIVTVIVIGTLIVGFIVALAVADAGGISKIGVYGDPRALPIFFSDLPTLFKSNLLSFVLTIAFGALGSFRTLGRAFATSKPRNSTDVIFGSAPTTQQPTYQQIPIAEQPTVQAPPAQSMFPQPTEYQNDVGPAPTGSADDKTAPPTV